MILVNFLKNLHSCIFPYEISGFFRKMNREMHLLLQGGYWQQERTLLNVELVDCEISGNAKMWHPHNNTS